MCTVWFNVMQESDSWDDGVRCPINTREELKKYDPVTYNFFAKILPDETLPAPWDEAAPDEYHTEYVDANAGTKRTESVENNFETDYFKLQTVSRGSEYQVDRYAPDETRPAEDLCLWFPWGTDGTDDNGAAWRLAKTEEGYYRFISPDGWSSVTATSESTVSVTGHMPDEEDTAQQWKFVENPSTALVYDGKMVNVKYGTEMVYSKPATSGSTLSLAEAGKGDNWLIRNTNQTLALGISAYLAPEKAEPENPENPDNSDNPAKPENPEKPGVEDNQKPSVKPADQTKPEAANAQSNTVKTGDTANVVLPIVMIVAAIAVVVGIVIYKKKR